MDVMQAIRVRRSVRRYGDKPLAKEDMNKLAEALRLAPSACNYQPWKFIMVTGKAARQELARASNNQTFVAEALLIVVGVGFPDRAYKRMGGSDNSAAIDVTIALDHMTLAATESGLGTCWIGAFDEKAVKAMLHVPPEARVVALVTVGHPLTANLLRPVEAGRRKPLDEVVCWEVCA